MCRTPPLAAAATSSSTRRRAHSSTRVFWCRALAESSMSSTTGQPRNRRHMSRVKKLRKKLRCGEKIENRAPKKRTCIQAAQQPPPATRQQHNYWVELVRVCRLVVVAAAAVCCSYCDNEDQPPPNEARAIRSEGRRAIPVRLAGRVIHTCLSCIFWPRGWGLSMSKYPTCSHESS